MASIGERLRRLAFFASPERTAASLSTAVIATVVIIALADPSVAGSTSASPRPSAEPSIGPSVPGASPSPAVDRDIEFVVAVNDRLLGARDDLAAKVAATSTPTGDFVAALRSMNTEVSNGLGGAGRLASRPETVSLGHSLTDAYVSIRDEIDAGLNLTVTDRKGLIAASGKVIKAFEALAPIAASMDPGGG